jgi:hypothetical protein
MLTTIIAIAAASAAASGPAAPALKGAAPVCQTLAPQRAAGPAIAQAPTPTPHGLNREPDPDALAAVLYSEGPCIKPIVVRERRARPAPQTVLGRTGEQPAATR